MPQPVVALPQATLALALAATVVVVVVVAVVTVVVVVVVVAMVVVLAVVVVVVVLVSVVVQMLLVLVSGAVVLVAVTLVSMPMLLVWVSGAAAAAAVMKVVMFVSVLAFELKYKVAAVARWWQGRTQAAPTTVALERRVDRCVHVSAPTACLGPPSADGRRVEAVVLVARVADGFRGDDL